MILYRQRLRITGYGLCNMDGDFNGNNQHDVCNGKLLEIIRHKKVFKVVWN